tara:strand:+ start:854 stop:1765 length:912 start_codon:yes stop_codon:yes gene_type:complete
MQVSVPVISIGNLTTGGTGKTPMVRYIASWLRDCGMRVTLLSRGYKAEQGHPNDEALELERRLPDVPHLQNPSRVESATVAIEEFAAQILLLDDGFQHRFLARDLDIVLIDATCPFGYGRLLPAGLLREPLASLSRAAMVIITRVDQVSASDVKAIRTVIHKYNSEVTIVEFSHLVEGLENYSGMVMGLNALVGKKVLAFAGIGNPPAFHKLLQAQGIHITECVEFEDHHRYDRDDIQQILSKAEDISAEAIICTMKDLVKIQVDRLGNIPLWALSVGTEPTDGQELLVQELVKIVELVKLDE